MILKRISNSLTSVQNAQEAANEEEKSSAGDKYETSRAMSHIEKDMHAAQLENNRMELAILDKIDCNSISNQVSTGSIVQCGETVFFVAAGLGKITFEDQLLLLISPHAPLAKLLFGKKVADRIEFNGKNFTITGLF